jgi:hypothetical protein
MSSLAEGTSGTPRSLRQQVAVLENQIMRRRKKVRMTVPAITGKVAAQLSSPMALLAAVGIGVAVEQASHHRGWSLATVLDASNACLGLLLSFSSLTQRPNGSAPGSRP